MPSPAVTERILAPLNESQRAAVEQIDGPLLILAGPGSGKTRVITHRIAWMVEQGVDPREIVALTFTNKAADELRNRLATLIPHAQVWAGTFHRFCSRMLRVYARYTGLQENFTIYDTGDSRKLLKQALAASDLDLRHFTPDRIANEISNLKNAGITAEQHSARPGNWLDTIVAAVYPAYQRMLQGANAVDFDDLLLHAAQMLADNAELRQTLDQRYTRMMVDEYQDTNVAQYRLIRLLNHEVRNLAVTGDPDQSIYGWRGANLGNILDFERDYPEVRVIRLEENYRSFQPILHAADQLIANNLRRKEKVLQATRPGGEPVASVAYPNPQEEAHDIASQIATAIRQGRRRPRDFAIFYRTNFLSRAFEHALRAHGIPYQVVQGLEFYQRREIKDLVAWLHLMNNERDRIAFERVINVPPRKIGKATLDKLRAWSLSAPSRSMIDACRQAANVPGISRAVAVRLSAFVALHDRLGEFRHDETGTILRKVIHETRYRDWLVEDGSEEGHERANNVDELVAAADEFDRHHPEDGGLEAFLEQTALVNDTDAWESESDFVTLLTIHSAKGLEFPAVYIVGLEDGILPHERSQANEEEVEEERRVLFVGITRAMERLQLSRCMTRFRNGNYWPTIASRFLMELPRESMEIHEPGAMEVWSEDQGSEPWDNENDYASNDNDSGREDFGGDSDSVNEHAAAWQAGAGPETQSADFGRKRAQKISSPPLPFSVARGPGGEGPGARTKPALSVTNGPGSAKPSSPGHPGLSTLITGSQLHDQMASRAPIDSFHLNQAVEHPEYGRGTIIELSGSGPKKTATVDFRLHGRRRFRLSHCSLRVVE